MYIIYLNASLLFLSKDCCPRRGGSSDGCLLVEPPALVLVFIYQARLNAIYTAKLFYRNKMTGNERSKSLSLSVSGVTSMQLRC